MGSLAGTGGWPCSLARLQTPRGKLQRSGTEHSQRLSWRCCSLALLACRDFTLHSSAMNTTLHTPQHQGHTQPAQSPLVPLLQGARVTLGTSDTHRGKKTEQAQEYKGFSAAGLGETQLEITQPGLHTRGCSESLRGHKAKQQFHKKGRILSQR